MIDNNDQDLEISPATELRFKGPFTQVVTSHLKLKNAGLKPLCYKVKTTAPKMYCVRPNSGLIEVGQAVDVSIMLQPFDYCASDKVRHKFLIQSLVADINNLENAEQIWRTADKDMIREIKLKCSFDQEQSAGDLETIVATETISTYTQPESTTAVEDMKKQILELVKENDKLKAAEIQLRKLALQDTLDNCTLPSVLIDDSTKHKMSNDIRLLVVLGFIAFFIGFVIAKFTL